MQLILVPGASSQRQVEIWVGAFDAGLSAPTAGVIRTELRSVSLDAGRWEPLSAGDHLDPALRRSWRQRVVIPGLQPGRRYQVHCECDATRSRCYTATLPERLPDSAQEPYVILQASCFYRDGDASGLAGQNVARLPAQYRPHVKLLTGDQVYLDNPPWEILPRSQKGLAQRFFEKYRSNWTQGNGQWGFSALLGSGATYFLADDHEFWNNHPNRSPLVLTRGEVSRNEWEDVARALFAEFERDRSSELHANQKFALGPLEFWLLDTRFARDPQVQNFMHPDALAELIDWLDRPGEPGVLVIGAPVFAKRAGWLASWLLDRSLANYAQYKTLAAALVRSRRNLLLLSGDVHFGRIAMARRPSSDTEIYEIVASPLALVSDIAGGRFFEAPAKFPTDRDGMPSRLDIVNLDWDSWTGPKPHLVMNHFLTLGFSGNGGTVHVDVCAWGIAEAYPGAPRLLGTKRIDLRRR